MRVTGIQIARLPQRLTASGPVYVQAGVIGQFDCNVDLGPRLSADSQGDQLAHAKEYACRFHRFSPACRALHDVLYDTSYEIHNKRVIHNQNYFPIQH